MISPDSKNLNAERRKLAESKKVMKVIKLLKNGYVLAKVTPKKNIRLQTSKLKLSEPAVNRQIYIQEQQRRGLKENDIIFTPDVVYKFMSSVLGYDVKQSFDPCPPPPVEWDGLQIDWDSPAYCNPPFSQEGGGWTWMEKCFEEAQKGTEVVVLINSTQYLMMGSGSSKLSQLQEWKKVIGFEMLSYTGDCSGIVHKWIKWGESMITGQNKKGSQFGVCIFRMTNKFTGERILPVTQDSIDIILSTRRQSVTPNFVSIDDKIAAQEDKIAELTAAVEGLNFSVVELDEDGNIPELDYDLNEYKTEDNTEDNTEPPLNAAGHITFEDSNIKLIEGNCLEVL
eukprot:SAG11_NODE_4465_length_1885_cov_76.792273_1_plen_339_part_10